MDKSEERVDIELDGIKRICSWTEDLLSDTPLDTGTNPLYATRVVEAAQELLYGSYICVAWLGRPLSKRIHFGRTVNPLGHKAK